MPEGDQQITGQAHEFPSHKEGDQLLGTDQQDHPPDEKEHLGVVAGLVGIAGHVVMGEMDVQEPQARGDEEHHQREFVDVEAERHGEIPETEPLHRDVNGVSVSQKDEQRRHEEGRSHGLGDPEGRRCAPAPRQIRKDCTKERGQEEEIGQSVHAVHAPSFPLSSSSGRIALVIRWVAPKISRPAAASSVARTMIR